MKRGKKKNYSVIIVTGETSSNKEFVISSRLIRNSIMFFILFLLIFGYMTADYISMGFNLKKRNVVDEKTGIETTIKEDNIDKKRVLEYADKAILLLQRFISYQKNELEKSENDLKKVRSEIMETKPLHEKSKKVFDSYFRIYSKFYEQKYKEKIWIERLIGFLIGIVASFLATLGYKFIEKRFILKDIDRSQKNK